MKVKLSRLISLAMIVNALAPMVAPMAFATPNATQLVEKAEKQTRGESLQAHLLMTVIRGTTEREMEVKVWTSGTDKAVVKVLAPAKDRDTGNLRLKYDLWQYLPNLERTIKIPPSMMFQSWMGSDFTNDDLVKTTSLARDYTHRFVDEETQQGMKAYKIELLPKKDAPIAWGKVILWVRKSDAVPIRQECYSESGELAKIMEGTDLKTFGTHTIATKLTMKLPRKPENETRLVYKAVEFDSSIPSQTFTQEFLKKKAK